jgi:hypothetical protein
LLVSFSTSLTTLARQADRPTTTRLTRQFFARWLSRPHWDPAVLFAALPELLRQPWQGRGPLPLLLDFTCLGGGGEGWCVFQVSVPWQGRALPVYRVPLTRSQPEIGQRELVLQVLDWLTVVLPGPRSRYVLVMDRGFPGHELINDLRARGWRFVLRVPCEWTVKHRRFQGAFRDARAAQRIGPRPECLPEAQLGWRATGPRAHQTSCRAHVVWYWGVGYQEPWYLVTSERRAGRAVAIYRQRMQIEAEFRDLKGPWGLDELVHWQDRNEVARFLAWVAVYEWRLAYLWWQQRLARLAREYQLYGKLSWIHLTRLWQARQLRRPREKILACL